MLRRLYNKYDQALIVGGCATISFATLGWMVNDIQLREKNKLKCDYENTIKGLKEEIATLKAKDSNNVNLK